MVQHAVARPGAGQRWRGARPCRAACRRRRCVQLWCRSMPAAAPRRCHWYHFCRCSTLQCALRGPAHPSAPLAAHRTVHDTPPCVMLNDGSYHVSIANSMPGGGGGGGTGAGIMAAYSMAAPATAPAALPPPPAPYPTTTAPTTGALPHPASAPYVSAATRLGMTSRTPAGGGGGGGRRARAMGGRPPRGMMMPATALPVYRGLTADSAATAAAASMMMAVAASAAMQSRPTPSSADADVELDTEELEGEGDADADADGDDGEDDGSARAVSRCKRRACMPCRLYAHLVWWWRGGVNLHAGAASLRLQGTRPREDALFT